MARKLRLQYPGAIYHVMSRGDRREEIFRDDMDRHFFLQTLAEACAKTDWQVHAYCLMQNHFHMVVETPKANLAVGMKWLLGTYTGRFNRRHRLSGHVFSGRYKSLLIDGSGNGYLKTVCTYVHLNPVRARLLKAGQSLAHYPWSSYREYVRHPARRAKWMRVDRLLGEMAIPSSSPAARKEFARRVKASLRQELTGEYEKIRRGWCYGEKAFRRELLLQASQQLAEHHYGPERQETEEAKAERLVQEDLTAAGWGEDELADKPKSHAIKVRLARRLREETTMSIKWIASRLRMGSWNYLNRRLYETRTNRAQKYKR